jgi:hypothetical protein
MLPKPLDGKCRRGVIDRDQEWGCAAAVEAATIITTGLTAWRALVVNGTLKAGDVVVVLGTGGVSVLALQAGIDARQAPFVVICTRQDGRTSPVSSPVAEVGGEQPFARLVKFCERNHFGDHALQSFL